jgi:hypothetical protein
MMIRWWREHPGWSSVLITVLLCGLLIANDASTVAVVGMGLFGLIMSAFNSMGASR